MLIIKEKKRDLSQVAQLGRGGTGICVWQLVSELLLQETDVTRLFFFIFIASVSDWWKQDYIMSKN